MNRFYTDERCKTCILLKSFVKNGLSHGGCQLLLQLSFYTYLNASGGVMLFCDNAKTLLIVSFVPVLTGVYACSYRCKPRTQIAATSARLMFARFL